MDAERANMEETVRARCFIVQVALNGYFEKDFGFETDLF